MKAKSILFALLTGLSAIGASAATGLTTTTPAEDMGSQKIRALVQIEPDDFICVDAHRGDFGQQIPAIIRFRPMEGRTGWWWNKITDYDQRVTRIREFNKILESTETCANYNSQLPRTNKNLDFERSIVGSSRPTMDHRQIGLLTETVNMIISPTLTLTGTFQWLDWSIEVEQFDPSRRFRDSLINEFAQVERDVLIETNPQSELTCVAVENHVDLTFRAGNFDESNPTTLHRAYASKEECMDALTALSQTLATRGRTWNGLIIQAHRTLYTTTRHANITECDTIRVERLETEVEGLKFVGTNFIPLYTSPERCRRD